MVVMEFGNIMVLEVCGNWFKLLELGVGIWCICCLFCLVIEVLIDKNLVSVGWILCIG